MVRALDAGLGAAEVLGRPGSGRVVSVHRRAAYLRLGDDLIALVGPGVDPGPLHVRCPVLPALCPGEAVTGDGRLLRGPAWAVGVPATVWRGALPDAAALAAHAQDGTVREAAGAALSVTVDPAVVPGGVDELAALLGGRGPGLTPSGDDVLAGVVLVARLAGGEAVEQRLCASVAAVPTTDVARAFLAWAARGQSIAPVHDWLLAVGAGDAPTASRALARLRAVGADSGRHLAAGLALGIGQLPRSATHMARAGTSPGLRHRT